MKKIVLIVLVISVFMLGACTGISGTEGFTAKDNELSKEVDTLDGNFSILVPDSWVKNFSRTEDEMNDMNMVLSYGDNDIAYVDIYFYNNVDYDYTLNDSLKYNLDYFADSIIGDYEEMTLDGMDVIFFESSMVDYSIEDEKLNYHGFLYMINTPYGVVEIDTYYAQEVLESKIVKPSEEQLMLLQDIAESLEVK